LFEPDFQMTEQIGWGLNDRDFLQQMIPRLTALPQPFAAWLITLSLHHPFENFPERYKTLKLGGWEGTSFGNYLHTMHFFDEALETFKASLAARGLLDSSVVLVFGDHDAGFVRDAALSRIIGIRADDVAWTLNDRVPLFMRIPDGGTDHKLQGRRPMPAGQTDVAPTVLALFGIDASGLAYVGRDLLGPPDGAVLRPYGEWLNSHYLFMTRATVPICRDLAANRDAANACGEIDREARRARAISRLVVETDLQERLRATSSTSVR
jgi:phosphoglycerol transferase MdoB-like AlkP superfamily enzyme